MRIVSLNISVGMLGFTVAVRDIVPPKDEEK